MAEVRSISVPLLADVTESLVSLRFLFFFFLISLRALESPHMFVPPCVEGMLSSAIPWSVGPSARFRGMPSHCMGWNRAKWESEFNLNKVGSLR